MLPDSVLDVGEERAAHTVLAIIPVHAYPVQVKGGFGEWGRAVACKAHNAISIFARQEGVLPLSGPVQVDVQ